MSTEMSTLTGAYAVDALSGSERSEFERHLESCEECAQEVHELRETASRLGVAAAAEPPEGLKRRVLREIAQTRQEPPIAEPVPIGSRASRARRGLGPRLAVAASVVAIAAAGAFGGMAWQSQRELDQAEQRLEQAGARGAEMAAVLQAEDARIVHGAQGGAEATAIVSRRLDRAMFMSERMPDAPTGHAHQLWAIGPDGASSMGVMEDERSPIVHQLPQEATKLGVTVEPAGGSEQPTTDPVMLLSLPG
ncbi:anti-sigma factor [Saccharopolyspora halophila]|uniref:Regulator of SigK n=1 Tax=Saccharopolyspora halophila TaxID=405551 RepID=A0ABP5TPL1_9PSEU